MNMQVSAILFVLNVFFLGIQAKKIVFFNPAYIVSNEQNLFQMAELLSDKGHEVTMYRLSSTHLENATSNNYIIHNLKINESVFQHSFIKNGIVNIPPEVGWDVSTMTLFGMSEQIITLAYSLCPVYEPGPLRDQIKNENYDLAIIQVTENICSQALTTVLGIPVVGIWSNAKSGFNHAIAGVQELPSIVPLALTSLPTNMDFYSRLVNFKTFIEGHFFFPIWNLLVADGYVKPSFPDFISKADEYSRLLLLLTTTNTIVETPTPTTRNVIPIGCITCKEAKPLTGEYMKFLDTPDNNGTIVISFGASFFKINVIPKNLVTSLYYLAANINMKIVIRFGSDYFDDLPNVLAVKYMPQQDLLGHPKTKLFISHCGIKGFMEAVNSGVPILCIPTYFDQGDNGVRAKRLGMGEYRVITDITPEGLLRMVHRMLQPENYQKYKEKAMRYSKISHDSLMNPQDTFIYWIEKALNNNLKYLITPSNTLNFFQFYALDIILLISSPFILWYMFM